MTGKIKETPEDFVVREILPMEEVKFSKLWSHYEATLKDTPSTSSGNDNAIENQPLNIAAVPQIPSFKLPSVPDQPPNESKEDLKASGPTQEQPRQKSIVGEIPSPTVATTVLAAS